MGAEPMDAYIPRFRARRSGRDGIGPILDILVFLELRATAAERRPVLKITPVQYGGTD